MSNQWSHKLKNFEVTPPSGVWSAIEEELNQAIPHSFSEKLRSFEAAPPPHSSWNKIALFLDQKNVDKKPIIKGKIQWLRYAAAAAVVVAIAGGIVFFNTGRTENAVALQSDNSTHFNESKSPGYPQIKSEDKAVKAESKNFGQDERSVVISKEAASEKDVAIAKKTTPSLTKRYLTLAMENGEKVRLSKKVFPVFECADNATASIRKRCKESIENLQQKMANTLTSPSTDFAGLIDMIKSLEENK